MLSAKTRARWVLALLGALVLSASGLAQPSSTQADTQGPSPLDSYVWEADIGLGRNAWPQGVTLDAAGNIYVTESDYNDPYVEEYNLFSQVAKYAAGGSTSTPVQTFGSIGAGNGQLDWPGHIAVDSTGRLIVADSNNNRISIFAANGTFVEHIEDGFNYPMGVTVDTADNIYVADTYNGVIRKYFPSGASYEFSIALPGSSPAPDGITIDPSGNIYVVDGFHSAVHQYSPTGTLLTTISSWNDGGQNQTFTNPQGLGLDPNLGVLYVADTFGPEQI
ncbi:MAG: NHL repeat-containing protein, partial [Actinomycetota bacterium]|nr:NHL repeat-containing protein [Actinomycetota bacterium]